MDTRNVELSVKETVILSRKKETLEILVVSYELMIRSKYHCNLLCDEGLTKSQRCNLRAVVI